MKLGLGVASCVNLIIARSQVQVLQGPPFFAFYGFLARVTHSLWVGGPLVLITDSLPQLP